MKTWVAAGSQAGRTRRSKLGPAVRARLRSTSVRSELDVVDGQVSTRPRGLVPPVPAHAPVGPAWEPEASRRGPSREPAGHRRPRDVSRLRVWPPANRRVPPPFDERSPRRAWASSDTASAGPPTARPVKSRPRPSSPTSWRRPAPSCSRTPGPPAGHRFGPRPWLAVHCTRDSSAPRHSPPARSRSRCDPCRFAGAHMEPPGTDVVRTSRGESAGVADHPGPPSGSGVGPPREGAVRPRSTAARAPPRPLEGQDRARSPRAHGAAPPGPPRPRPRGSR